MAVIIAAADYDFNSNFSKLNINHSFLSIEYDFRSYLKQLANHFGLLCATQPVHHFDTFSQPMTNYFFNNSNNDVYLKLPSFNLSCDVFLQSILTLLISQNESWKYSSNIALIEFLDTVELICYNMHTHPSLSTSDVPVICEEVKPTADAVHALATKKYWVIIRSILKELEKLVIANTNAVLDGISMALTVIAHKMQSHLEILTADIIEQFLMTAIKAGKYSFIKESDDKRHSYLKKLTNTFLDAIYPLIDHFYSSNDTSAAEHIPQHSHLQNNNETKYKSVVDVFTTVCTLSTKMHMVPIGSRQIMCHILQHICQLSNISMSELVLHRMFKDSICKKWSEMAYITRTSVLNSSRNCGIFETFSWCLKQKLLLKVFENGNFNGQEMFIPIMCSTVCIQILKSHAFGILNTRTSSDIPPYVSLHRTCDSLKDTEFEEADENLKLMASDCTYYVKLHSILSVIEFCGLMMSRVQLWINLPLVENTADVDSNMDDVKQQTNAMNVDVQSTTTDNHISSDTISTVSANTANSAMNINTNISVSTAKSVLSQNKNTSKINIKQKNEKRLISNKKILFKKLFEFLLSKNENVQKCAMVALVEIYSAMKLVDIPGLKVIALQAVPELNVYFNTLDINHTKNIHLLRFVCKIMKIFGGSIIAGDIGDRFISVLNDWCKYFDPYVPNPFSLVLESGIV